jgi:hypothetical protein
LVDYSIVSSPHEEYRRRLAERREAARELQRTDDRIGSAGLWCVSAAALGLFLTLVWKVSPVWFLGGVAGALVFRAIHARLEARRRPFEAGARFYEEGLERVEDRWIGRGRSGEGFLDPEHPCAADLDLFGRGSLFERLCTARTRTGERTLARWLLDGAAPEEVRARQAAVGELKVRLDLREELALLSEDVQAEVDPAELAKWGRVPAELNSTGIVAGSVLLPIAVFGTLAAIPVFEIGASPFFAALAALIGFARWTVLRVRRVAEPAERAERELDVLARVLGRLEREEFRAPKLAALQAALRGAPAAIGRLARLVQLLQSARNELAAPFLGLVLWRLQFARAMERWRTVHGPSIEGWLAAAGEAEALSSLAAFAYERPSDPFPEIADAGPVFEAVKLGHPLIPDRTCVRNDVRFGAAPAVLVVSGSNMSGKSTLLRAVGTTAVLALAGAPVRAARLRISAMSIGSTIRVQDSLQLGTSRFFAEVKRLRQLMDLAKGPRPLLFLLEELLSGTNSHDRKTGAEILIREFVKAGAAGLLTTHDLALAEAAGALGEKAANVHFEDQVAEGKLVFDYVLRPGPVAKSNALALMRAVGLPV